VGDPPDALQRLGPAAAEPDLQGILDWARDGCQVVERPALGAMIDRIACPPGPQQAEHLLEHVTAARAVESEGLALAGLAEAGREAEEPPATGDLIELGQ